MKATIKKLFPVADGTTGRGAVGMLGMVLAVLLVCTTCKRREDSSVSYYDAVGTGYVFMYDSAGNKLYPVQGAEILLQASLGGCAGSGFMAPSPPDETCITDANGKYQVRFVKRAYRCDVVRYYFTMRYNSGCCSIGWYREFEISVDRVNYVKKTFTFDTLKLYINEHEHFNF